ncbi:unnamed protein product [Paramecium pentaurelia]|uniref:Uncharacterized protein n=1 Tax=Paramecium pentaurelia TaxID=43138 RepID=A0A8S1WUK5_9CILI|nr:unnamed protein product [Paramecium pentaurelia]
MKYAEISNCYQEKRKCMTIPKFQFSTYFDFLFHIQQATLFQILLCKIVFKAEFKVINEVELQTQLQIMRDESSKQQQSNLMAIIQKFNQYMKMINDLYLITQQIVQ